MLNLTSENATKIIFLLIFVYMTYMPMKVEALAPVTYTCCYDYTYNDGIQLANFENNAIGGIQLDDFENLSNWTIRSNVNTSQEADTINFTEGNQGLRLITKNGDKSWTTKKISYNFSNTNTFGIWVYLDDLNASTFNYMQIAFSSTADFSKYLITKYTIHLNAGWNRLVLSKSDFTPNYATDKSESWNNVMNSTRLLIYPNAGKNTSVVFDDLRYNVTSDWIVGTNSSREADTINFTEGNQGLRLIAKNGTYAYTDLPINNDFSTTNNFAIWTYVDNASNHNGIMIYITSNESGFSSKFFYDIEYHAVKTGWNKLVFNKNNFRNIGGDDWNNIMKRVRLAIIPSPNTNLNVTFDDLRYNTTGKRAKLIITTDDGGESIYTKAYPILSANNQPAVAFIVTSFVENQTGPARTDMNLTQLKTLQSSGWDISSHMIHHDDLASLDDSTLTREINGSYDWFVSNNFQKSAGFMAYPYGFFSDHVIDMVKKRYILGRATQQESAQQHFISTDDSIRYIQRTISIHNDTTVQSVKDSIDATINSKLLGIIYMHKFADSNPTNDIYTTLTSDFQNISDYIKSRSADIDVITYSDYVIPDINDFTPVINKTTRIYQNGTSVLITKNKYDEYMPNMTVKPSSGSIDVDITTYDETGGVIKFNESSPNSNLQVSYEIGDRIPNQPYRIIIYWTNGTKYQDFNILADSTGYIKYISEGFGDSRYQEINIISQRSSFNIFYNVI